MKCKLQTKITRGLLLIFMLMVALVGFCIYTIAYVNSTLGGRNARDFYMEPKSLEIEGLYIFMNRAGIIVIIMTVAVLLSFLVLSLVIAKSIIKPIDGIWRSTNAPARTDSTVKNIKTEGESIQNELISVHVNLEKNIDDMQNASQKVSEGIGNVWAASKELSSLLESLDNKKSLTRSSCQSKSYGGKVR